VGVQHVVGAKGAARKGLEDAFDVRKAVRREQLETGRPARLGVLAVGHGRVVVQGVKGELRVHLPHVLLPGRGHVVGEGPHLRKEVKRLLWEAGGTGATGAVAAGGLVVGAGLERIGGRRRKDAGAPRVAQQLASRPVARTPAGNGPVGQSDHHVYAEHSGGLGQADEGVYTVDEAAAGVAGVGLAEDHDPAVPAAVGPGHPGRRVGGRSHVGGKATSIEAMLCVPTQLLRRRGVEHGSAFTTDRCHIGMKLPFFLASRFVAGETLADSLPAVDALNRDGLHVALDKLGEHVHDRSAAVAARDTYIDLVRTLAGRDGTAGLRNRISIKLSMMGQLIDEDFCEDNLRQLLEVAAERDMFVRLDMEGSDLTRSTLNIFEAVYPDFPNHVGPVLQAMLKRTDRDIDRMCELGVSVRLCKGAYAEPAEIAYQDMGRIRERYLDYMERLLQHTDYSGIATHDDQIIDATKAFADRHDIGPDSFEFQMLYGLRRETQREMAQAGYNMLVYVPYGTEWFPYFSRRLREKKENVWFVLRSLFKG